MRFFSSRSIRTKLLAAFILTGLTPLVVASFGSIRLATKALMEKSLNQLAAVQDIRKHQVQTAVRERNEDLRAMAASRDAKDLFRLLHDIVPQLRLTPQDPFPAKSEACEKISAGYKSVFKETIDAYGFDDFYLITATNGRVLFNLSRDDSLGANLKYGSLSDSGLAKIWGEVTRTGSAAMTDFTAFGPAKGAQSAFLGYPVLGLDGKLAGVAAVRLGPGFIETLMDSREGMGDSGESYLIGMDRSSGRMAFRSAMKTMGGGKYIVGYVPNFTLSYWEAAAKTGSGIGEYVDSAGNGVLTAFNKLDIPGVDWFLISKIDKAEVMAPLNILSRDAALTGLVLTLLITVTALLVSRNFTRPILQGMQFAKDISEGRLDTELTVRGGDELARLADALNAMARNLHQLDWFKSGKELLDDTMRGELGARELAKRFIGAMVRQLGAQMGAVYFSQEEGVLELAATHAFSDRAGNFNHIWPGEGLVGQSVMERETILFSNIAETSPMLNYGAGEVKPTHYLVAPLVAGKEVIGAFLVGSVTPLEPRHVRFVEQNAPNAAVLLSAARSRRVIRDLLKQAQDQQNKLADANKDLEDQAQALRQSEAELQAQQEELRVTNEELEEQTKALKESQAELQAQQEELQVINEELEERTQALSEQKEHIQKKNVELVRARSAINQKAQELEVASRYKSEFLANMSHELRTPLNSILILSQLLTGNREGNLTERQQESAQAIHSSGSELLKLINDILDLSKVEAGKIELQVEHTEMGGFLEDLRRVFKDMAADKGLEFVIEKTDDAPDSLHTDPHRLQQVLRNLLSNAFKFTSEGTVSLTVRRPTLEEIEDTPQDAGTSVAFSVRDQGIGIPEDKQALIFEAFKQADGSTSRTYGGTGLGLSISRELTKLLGGVIRLRSTEGEGSEFTIILPERYSGPARDLFQAVRVLSGPTCELRLPASEEEPDAEAVDQPETATDWDGKERRKPAEEAAQAKPAAAPSAPKAVSVQAKPAAGSQPATPGTASETAPERPQARSVPVDPSTLPSTVKDDRRTLSPGDRILLIIEDDPHFCRVLRDLAHERGFKCLIAQDGETGLHFADFHRPSAIILDIGLPGIDGWTVMERLKSNPETRHIPVHFMSATDSSLDAMRMGAVGFMTKPVSLEKIDQALGRIEKILSRSMSTLLVVEDDPVQRDAIKALIGGGDVKTTTVASGREALEELRTDQYDCMILDLGLHDMSGFELLELIRGDATLPRVPIIIYTGRDITQEEESQLTRYAESIIIKGARSPERLLEESALFLHRVEASMPEDRKRQLKMVHDKEAILAGRRVLLVDDDMRNVFALTSVLEDKGIETVIARNGQESLDKLREHPDLDLVLMDIMMPGMDGYEAMRHIRKDPRHKKLPIIALTAKAMAGDRAKCIEAGASDYLAKPVNTEKLISMLRVWLYK